MLNRSTELMEAYIANNDFLIDRDQLVPKSRSMEVLDMEKKGVRRRTAAEKKALIDKILKVNGGYIFKQMVRRMLNIRGRRS